MNPDPSLLSRLERILNLETNAMVRYLVVGSEMEVRDEYDRRVLTFYQDWYRALEQSRRAIQELLEDAHFHPFVGPWPLGYGQYNYLTPTYLLAAVIRYMTTHLQELESAAVGLEAWPRANELVTAILERERPFLDKARELEREAPVLEVHPAQPKGTSASRW